MVQPRLTVAPPAAAPLPFGLLSAALTTDEADEHFGFGVQYETDRCGRPHRTVAACFDDQNQGAPFDLSDEAQQITEGGAGLTSFTLTFDGQTTGAIAAAATAAAVRTALEALSNIAPGDVVVTGSAGGPYTVAFAGQYADVDVPQMTATPTGGTGTVNVTTTSPGQVLTQASEGHTVVEGDAFMVFAIHTCRAVGETERAQESARAKLDSGDYIAIEEAVAATMLDSASDLTPVVGTGVSPTAALGILEQYAASNYPAQPVVHTPRVIGTHLAAAGAIDRFSGRLESKQGALVASYSGLPPAGQQVGPGDTVAGAGERWMWVTGLVAVRRGPASVSDVIHQQRAGAYTNQIYVLAQRPVVVTYECIAAAVLVAEPS